MATEQIIKEIFKNLDSKIKQENAERESNGAMLVSWCEIKILGQISLFLDEGISAAIELNHTGDLDALIESEYFVKKELGNLLRAKGLYLDPDSSLVFIPPLSKFEELWRFETFVVYKIDAESALVSKAIKAKEKNKNLVASALASNLFPNLAERITNLGGQIAYFFN